MRVLFFREDTMWIAQCLEYDIAAQAATLAEAKAAFALAFAAQIAVALHYGETPLADFKPAPRRYWDMLEAVESEPLAEPIRIPEPVNIPPAFMVDAGRRSLANGWVNA